jgi:hypothetical protein
MAGVQGPGTPDFAQEDRRKTSKGKGKMRGFFAALRMTKRLQGLRMTGGGQTKAKAEADSSASPRNDKKEG